VACLRRRRVLVGALTVTALREVMQVDRAAEGNSDSSLTETAGAGAAPKARPRATRDTLPSVQRDCRGRA
jgi:hypothetical protein